MRLAAAVELTVPFHDLDAVQIVWHGHYAKYLELARDALMEKIGYSHGEMRASGFMWPVVELRLRYLQPARLRQRLRVQATLLEFEQRLKIGYEILDAAGGRRLTRAHTVQVPVRIDGGQMLYATPPVLREKIAAALRRLGAEAA
ncbi:MAG: acyl-CoA thioesterase [Burkholderiaceae bacterium]|nr:acyl-CoA thioesterase [Burkholderiaceae bacterium]MCX7901922.1 acyl-CoA thioesterase [Burkholderiaceae bacterium]